MAKDITAALVEMAREHFEIYMAVVHMTDQPDIHDGHALAAEHHRQMIGMLLSDDREILMICPRGSGKTTLIAGWHEWRLGKASESGDKHWADRHRVLYVSAAASQAYKVSNAIRATIEGNADFQAIFPKVKPHPKKWGEEEWKVQGNTIKDSNFQAVGIDGAALGSRADEITLDDVGDEKNMGTSYQRQVVKDRLDNTIMPILVPGGRVVKLCTRWAWDDAADWAMKRGFKTLLIKALTGDEETGYESYWGTRFTVEWLLSEREKNPKSFARQYQNEVVPDEGLIFERAWFEPRFDYLPSEVRWRVCSWDTAAGQGRNRSFSAGWSALVTPDFHVYLYRLTRGQVTYPYLREAIRHQANEDKAHFVIIEKKSSGHQVIQEYALENNPWRVIEWQPFGQRGSPTRLEANEKIGALCQTGMVHLPSEYFMRKMGAPWLPDAEKEIFSYPDGESDDIVDAMCQMLYWVQEQRQAWERRLRNTNTEPGQWKRITDPAWGKVRV